MAVSGVRTAYSSALLKSGVIGIQVRIMPSDIVLPDHVEILPAAVMEFSSKYFSDKESKSEESVAKEVVKEDVAAKESSVAKESESKEAEGTEVVAEESVEAKPVAEEGVISAEEKSEGEAQ